MIFRDTSALLRRHESDLGNFYRVPVDARQADRALRLVREHALRGADALHLAAAMELHDEIPRGFRLCSSDREQLRAARAEGLRTIALGQAG